MKFSKFSLNFSLLLLLLAQTGCETIPVLGGMDESGQKVYLTEKEAIPQAIEKFAASQDLASEESKINYLLSRMERSRLTFIRNGSRYTSQEAADFLRWKLNRPRWRPLVNTARDFVLIVSAGSIQSGDPYHVIYAPKIHRDLKSILANELDFLEDYLKNKS